MTAGTPLFLVGFMGCGKTTCAKAIAGLTGRPFLDTDDLVERRAGSCIESIFREAGETEFRRIEASVLRSLDRHGAPVVATGGGIFESAANRRWMQRAGPTVWLDATFEAVRRRVGEGAGRPLWPADDPIALRALFERRRAAYALCHIRVAVESRDPTRVAEAVIRQIL